MKEKPPAPMFDNGLMCRPANHRLENSPSIDERARRTFARGVDQEMRIPRRIG